MYDEQLIAINRETDVLNVFNRHWAAVKNNRKITAEIDLNQQINSLLYQLALSQPVPIVNQPSLAFGINWDLLPKGLKEQVWKISAALGWDSVSILMTKLTNVAMASSGVFQIHVRPGWTEELVLYVMLTAESGAGKSRLINLNKKPMNVVMDGLRSKHEQTAGRQALIAKEQAKAVDKMRQENQKKRIQAELQQEGRCDYNKLIQLVAEEVTEASEALNQAGGLDQFSRPDFFISNGTSKGIQEALLSNHEFQAICEPEGGLIKAITEDSRFDIDLILKAHGGEEHQITTSRERKHLKRPRLVILYGIQPGVAAKFFGSSSLIERGLTSRFLPLFPRLLPRQNIEGVSLDDDEWIIKHILTTCYEQNRAGIIRVMMLDREANQMITNFEYELDNMIPNGFDHMASFINKLRGTACRLAGALHLWANSHNPDEIPISARTMFSAIELARTLLPQADYAYNSCGLKAYAVANIILEWIKKHSKPHFDLRFVLQDKGLKKSQALPALDVLDMHHILRQITTPRNAVICVVNPHIHGTAANYIAAPAPALPSPLFGPGQGLW